MSLAQDLNTGGVCDAVAARFARADEERRAELERLIRAGRGDKEPPRRALRAVEREETPMPRKTKPEPKGPCPECHSPTCHKKTCSRRPGGPVLPAPRPAAPSARPAPAPAQVEKALRLVAVQQATAEQLVETIAACRAELEQRQEQLRAQLEQVAKAIGTAA